MDEDDLRAVLAVSNRLGEQSSKRKAAFLRPFFCALSYPSL